MLMTLLTIKTVHVYIPKKKKKVALMLVIK